MYKNHSLNKIILTTLFIGSSLSAETIKIAVAANVSYAIQDLKQEFKKSHPDTKILVTLGSSGKLTAQIKNGAPYQIFLSANMKYPQELYKDATAITKPIVYANGSLAYLSNKNQKFTTGINILKTKKIAKIAIANPKTAPYGKAALEAIKNAGILDNVKNKLVYAESISQTVSYTVVAADIGIVAKSSLYSPLMSKYKKDINWADVDTKLYTPINQGIVLLKNGKDVEMAKAFYNFILGEKAKKIFRRFGYICK